MLSRGRGGFLAWLIGVGRFLPLAVGQCVGGYAFSILLFLLDSFRPQGLECLQCVVYGWQFGIDSRVGHLTSDLERLAGLLRALVKACFYGFDQGVGFSLRSEEHPSELQS